MNETLTPLEPPTYNEIADIALEALESQVVEAAAELWSRDGEPQEIYMRSGTNLCLDTAPLSDERFAGYGVALGISYGPDRYFLGVPGKFSNAAEPIMSDDTAALRENITFDVRGSLLMREQNVPDIIPEEQAKRVSADLKSIGLTQEVGYKFSTSEPVEVPTDQKFQYDREITLSEITNPEGTTLDLLLTLNLGFSDSSSSEANQDHYHDSKRDAQDALDNGELVSPGFNLPRMNQVSFRVCSRNGQEIANTQQTKEQLEAALTIGMRSLEIVLDVSSQNEDEPHEITLKRRSASEMKDLSKTQGEPHPDAKWMDDLFDDN